MEGGALHWIKSVVVILFSLDIQLGGEYVNFMSAVEK